MSLHPLDGEKEESKMAGYEEDFWGEDFFEGEESNEETTETVEETEETAEDSAAEGGGAEDEGIGTETDMDPKGARTTSSSTGDPTSTAEEGQEFSPELLERIEAETQKRVDARIARQFEGITNPYTNQPIRTEADLAAYRSAFAAEQQRQQLEEMGVSKEVLDNYIQNHPAMQQAQQVIRKQEQQAANDFMAKEFETMKKEFPDCGLESPEQLNETEAGQRALQMWANTPGITLADAYAATHRKEISKKQSAAAKQAAMNEMNSKGHLRQTKGSNAKGDVPAEIAAEYKKYFPKATAAEISEMYWKNQKATE